jgi:hypothetical protein
MSSFFVGNTLVRALSLFYFFIKGKYKYNNITLNKNGSGYHHFTNTPGFPVEL